jgi:hypothetical protein
MIFDSLILPCDFITNKTTTSSAINKNDGWFSFNSGGKFEERSWRWSWKIDSGEELSFEVVANEIEIGRRGVDWR